MPGRRFRSKHSEWAKGKPVLFGEVGNPPVLTVFEHQPKWSSWVIWAGMVRNLTKRQYLELHNNPRMLSREDPAYWEVLSPFRKVCGLPPLPSKDKYPVNFSGEWVLNEERSELGNGGTGNVPKEIDDMIVLSGCVQDLFFRAPFLFRD
jgi:hypothetical protein